MLAGRARSWIYASSLAFALACCGPLRVHAQAPSALSWVRQPGAEGCIGAPELGARVERLVGPVLVAAPSAEVSVEGGIARQGRRFVAKIVISDARGVVLGEREVQGAVAAQGIEPDCRALDDQLAFVIAVAIDPNAALAELPGELAPEGDPGAELLADLRAHPPQPAKLSPAAPVEAGEAPQPEDPAEESEPWHIVGAVGAGLGIGMLPAASSALMLEGGAGTGWLTLRGHVAFTRSQHRAAQDLKVELAWLDTGLSGCAALGLSEALVLELCAGAIAARLSADAVGFGGPQQQRWLFGPRASARLALELMGPLSLVLDAAAFSVWPKHSVAYQNVNDAHEVYAVPAVSGSLRTLLELRFPL